MNKRLLAFIPLLMILLMLLPIPVAALPSSQLWESYETGVDADYEVYSNEWYGQTFTITPYSHSINEIRLLIYREGYPGTVTVSIKETDDSGLPTGADLTSGTLDGDIVTNSTSGAWYAIALTEYRLDYGGTYAIVIRAEAGDADNSLYVRLNGSGASYTGGSEVTSSNGGTTWAADTDDDIYFEVRGKALIELTQAKVFRNYIEDDDMHFVCQYYNVYTPYYPVQDSNYYFTLQLRSTNGVTVLAQTTCRAWGYKPGSIYLNADSAAGLTSGSAYRIYIYGNMAEAPIAYYTLTSADWRGKDLALLDTWVISTAKDIAGYYNTDMTAYISAGEVLNEVGGVIFATGILGLQNVRPDIFQTTIYIPEYHEEDWDDAYERDTTWQEQVGGDAAEVLDTMGDVFGITGREFGGFMFLAGYLLVSLLIVGLGGNALVGALLGIPIVITGTWLHLLNIALIAILSSIAVLLLMYRFWWSRT